MISKPFFKDLVSFPPEQNQPRPPKIPKMREKFASPDG